MSIISKNFFDQTEKPGENFSNDEINIICNRYKIASDLSFNKKVLEIGFGTGLGINTISNISKEYFGIEFSDENYRFCKKKYPNKNLKKGDAHNLPYADKSFDIIIALAIVYYLDFDKFIKEVRRVLKVGGKIFFCSTNKDFVGFNPSPYTTKYYNIKELNQILIKNHFKSKFFYAFKSYQNLYLKLIKTHIIKFIKIIFLSNSITIILWNKFRKFFLKKNITLPNDILNYNDFVFEEPIEVKDLLENNNYRIIYTISKKK